MSNEHRTTISFGNIGLSTILTLVFLVLKLCGVIDWAWIFVFLPMIISVGLTIIIALIVFVFTLIVIKYGDRW